MKPTFSNKLEQWSKKNTRNLPWVNIKDAYRIWVSEIMLQQTRVDQGLPYYERFIERYPDVMALARSGEDELMKYWEGLGYYSRARNLLKAARLVATQYEGRFPDTYEGIRALPGIGDYTAAAIASFAFGLPYAVVDGNVIRVLSRIYGIRESAQTSKGKKMFAEKAQEVLNHKVPGRHNQAIMDFGAVVCTPARPACTDCIFRSDCFAYNHNCIQDLPVKKKKKPLKMRYFNYLVIESRKRVFLQRRNQADIWRNLYEFPLVETSAWLPATEILNHKKLKSCFEEITFEIADISGIYKQSLSHQRIHARFIQIKVLKGTIESDDYIQVHWDRIREYAFPKIISLFLN